MHYLVQGCIDDRTLAVTVPLNRFRKRFLRGVRMALQEIANNTVSMANDNEASGKNG